MGFNDNRKETPLLFQPHLIGAIDLDLKTATRRLHGLGGINEFPDRWEVSRIHATQDRMTGFEFVTDWEPPLRITIKSDTSYGGVGDLLWVREAWAVPSQLDYLEARHVYPNKIWFKSHPDWGNENMGRVRSPIHLPKRLARLWLVITHWEIQRLQDITDEGAIAEGIAVERCIGIRSERECFGRLWDEINGPGAFEKNPWVHVIGFEKTARPKNPVPIHAHL